MDGLSTIFLALADPSRRALMEQLQKREATVTELAAPHTISAFYLTPPERTRAGRAHYGNQLRSMATGRTFRRKIFASYAEKDSGSCPAGAR